MKMTTSYFVDVLFILLLFECTCGGLGVFNTDVCADDAHAFQYMLRRLKSSDKIFKPLINKKDFNFTCLLYPTHELSCSWSFRFLEKEAQITTTVSVCEEGKTVQTLESQGSVGSRRSQTEKSPTSVILHFNISLHDQWALYYFKYSAKQIEVLPPPQNVTATFKDNHLFITWDPPSCRTYCPNHCLEYKVRLRDKEKEKNVNNGRFYTEQDADLTQSYTVRIKTRIDNFQCPGSDIWSDWSPPVILPATQSGDQPNAAVIVAMSLGIPMIILALLLLVCQRVSKRLFPPVPSPALHILENTEPFDFPDLMANSDKKITLVFYSEEEKSHKI